MMTREQQILRDHDRERIRDVERSQSAGETSRAEALDVPPGYDDGLADELGDDAIRCPSCRDVFDFTRRYRPAGRDAADVPACCETCYRQILAALWEAAEDLGIVYADMLARFERYCDQADSPMDVIDWSRGNIWHVRRAIRDRWSRASCGGCADGRSWPRTTPRECSA